MRQLEEQQRILYIKKKEIETRKYAASSYSQQSNLMFDFNTS